MEAFPKKITDFLKKHHVVTIATCENNQPWCFNAFYTFDEETPALIITSHDDTKHVQQVLKNSQVSGSVVLETEDEKLIASAHTKLKNVTVAAKDSTEHWLYLEPHLVKITDNSLEKVTCTLEIKDTPQK